MITDLISKEKAIRQLVENLEKSWNAHDAKMYSETFATDAEFTTVFGQVSHGRKAIEEGHARVLSSVFKNSSISITETRIRFIKPDVASVAMKWIMQGANLWNENFSRERKGLLTWTLIYQNERWEIVLAHNAELPEVPGPLQLILQEADLRLQKAGDKGPY
jgi:uncharacterized protein (TIGR02246 family)